MANRFSRRRALGSLLGAAGGAALLGAGVATPLAWRFGAGSRAFAAAPPNDLPQPKLLRSAHGNLALTLTAMPGVVDMRAPRPVTTYTYDNVVPGYTWELTPGDVLTVDLINNLPALPHPGVAEMTRPHEWTWTNLHTHGLHVSPSGIADNIFLEIPPGGRQHYEIPLPNDHPPGIFWYHPHRHGAVTQQVRAGMAGMIIVRGDLDAIPEVRAAREQAMVLQAIELGADYQLLDPIPNPSTEEAFFPRKQILYTVNGVLNPTITMYPGEIQRWRLLNAAEGKFMSLRLENHAFNVLAWDGLTLSEPAEADLLLLSSGNRADVLVRAGRPGTYHLVLTPGSSQKPNIPGMPDYVASATPAATAAATPMPGMLMLPGELTVRPILTLEVAGSGPAMALPRALPAWNPPIRPIARRREVNYTVQRLPDTTFLSFGIDGLPFDPARAPYQAKLGTAEEWTIVNAPDAKLLEHAHVFHIHVNPFQITRINGKALATPLWRDTFVLTKTTGDSFTFVTNFDDYTGKFVEHCHVLSHEDLGMMEAIEVVE